MDANYQIDNQAYYATLNLPKDASSQAIKKAYRSLAQVFHPDKHLELESQQHAQVAFSKLQEAYEVLSDPRKRQIYDVYGKEGLSAGLEVGDKLKSTEELRKEWEEFKAKQERQRMDASTSVKGLYLCRIHLPELLAGNRDERHQQLPLFRAAIVQNSFDAALSAKDHIHLQGQAALRNHAGSASIVCGYKRILTDHDSLDISAIVGLRSLLSVSVHRQLSSHTQATLTGSLTSEGVGLQVSSFRQLSETITGTFGWVIGPTASSGMSLSLAKRGHKYIVSGKLEVGVSTALSARISYLVAESMNVRLQGRIAYTGMDLELGLWKRFSSQSTGYMATVVGTQGIILKLRYSRGGQSYEVPVLLSHSASSPALVAAAYVLPPLTAWCLSKYVVRPLIRWNKQRQEYAASAEVREQVEQNLKEARMELGLLLPVATRKAIAEKDKQGLLILTAWYGLSPSTQVEKQATVQNGGPSTEDGPAPFISAMDVTEALQYLVSESKLALHAGFSKVGLLGFADPAPKADKELHVVYSIANQVYEVCIKDEEGIEIPGQGAQVQDAGKANAFLAMLTRYGTTFANPIFNQERHSFE